MKIAVQMDHPSRLKPASDTSFMLIEEAQARGHAVFFYEAAQLSWVNGELRAPLAPIRLDFAADTVWTLGAAQATALHGMDVVLMRQDPPFDMAYITATHLLERLAGDVRVWNDPAGVRGAPEKLSVLGFAAFMPPTLISRDPAEIAAFAAAHEAIVAKPLYGFGGRSVFKLARGDRNLETLLEQWSESSREPLMWQQFRPEVRDADTRVLLINGEVKAAFGRTPEGGSIRANMRVGGQAVARELTARQQTICDALGPFLKTQGLMLAGIDLIGDYLTEINVTSPTGLRAAQKLYGINLAAHFWDAV
ncbi:MAG: glutathione synthase [Alphaproteobacteria bacterium]|nr:glutathione synthase [Alphaproteobacteria bacterium]